MKKKLLLLSLVFLLWLIGKWVSESFAAQGFKDVNDSHYFWDAINYVSDEDIVDWYPDWTYKSDSSINRAEFTKILINALFKEAEVEWCLSKSWQPFPDVTLDQWFAKYICLAKEKWIIAWYPDWTFWPGNDVAFTEASKILVWSFGKEVLQDTSQWFKPYVEKLDEANVAPATIVDFAEEISRWETAEVIYRMKENITNKPSVNFDDLSLLDWDRYITPNSDITGDISVKVWNLVIWENCDIKWNITVVNWNLKIWANCDITWNVRLVRWFITVWSNVTINWNVDLEEWKFAKSTVWDNITINWNVKLVWGGLNINANYDVTWIVEVIEWNLEVWDNADFWKLVTITNWDLIVWSNATFKWGVDVVVWWLSMWDNNDFEWKFTVKKWVSKKWANNKYPWSDDVETKTDTDADADADADVDVNADDLEADLDEDINDMADDIVDDVTGE